ncbi:MAG: chorismate mutase [Clostridia bacterium]|nr:chorismate mutase [Clostridia bacterium]
MEEKKVKAIRGAVCAEENTAAAILAATRELLQEIIKANDLETTDVISAIFTVTRDLDAAFPAEAARQLGWREVPLLCTNEIPVPGSLPRTIRVLLHIYSNKNKSVKHIYLGAAATLRPDIA